MVEEDTSFEFMSSQESLPLSQETFDFMWNELAKSVSKQANSELMNVDNLASASGLQIENNAIKQEAVELESSDLNNAPEEHRPSGHTSIFHREQPIEQVVVSSSVPQEIPVVPTVYVPSSLPASQTWPGEYDFTVSFSPQEKSTKGVAWTYSAIKDKLYVGKDVPCPVNFSANTLLPSDVSIRVMALYTSPEQVSEIVQRCVNHSMEEIKNGIYEAEHLVRCESSMATYHIDATTNRHSVVVPFENPQAGQQYSTYIYKFTCFGSCAGGPNRRPLMLIFTLERGNQVIGRRKLDVKICACPGRDRKTEEGQLKEGDTNNSRTTLKRKESCDFVNLSDTMSFTKSVSYPPPKKAKVSPSGDGYYTIHVEDKGCYEFLVQMKRFYEMCKVMKGLTPDLTKALMYYQRKKNGEKSE